MDFSGNGIVTVRTVSVSADPEIDGTFRIFSEKCTACDQIELFTEINGAEQEGCAMRQHDPPFCRFAHIAFDQFLQPFALFAEMFFRIGAQCIMVRFVDQRFIFSGIQIDIQHIADPERTVGTPEIFYIIVRFIAAEFVITPHCDKRHPVQRIKHIFEQAFLHIVHAVGKIPQMHKRTGSRHHGFGIKNGFFAFFIQYLSIADQDKFVIQPDCRISPELPFRHLYRFRGGSIEPCKFVGVFRIRLESRHTELMKFPRGLHAVFHIPDCFYSFAIFKDLRAQRSPCAEFRVELHAIGCQMGEIHLMPQFEWLGIRKSLFEKFYIVFVIIVPVRQIRQKTEGKHPTGFTGTNQKCDPVHTFAQFDLCHMVQHMDRMIMVPVRFRGVKHFSVDKTGQPPVTADPDRLQFICIGKDLCINNGTVRSVIVPPFPAENIPQIAYIFFQLECQCAFRHFAILRNAFGIIGSQSRITFGRPVISADLHRSGKS